MGKWAPAPLSAPTAPSDAPTNVRVCSRETMCRMSPWKLPSRAYAFARVYDLRHKPMERQVFVDAAKLLPLAVPSL